MKVRRNSNVSVNNFNYLLKLKLSIKFYWHTGTILTLTDEPYLGGGTETAEREPYVREASPDRGGGRGAHRLSVSCWRSAERLATPAS